jgi:arylsulfatase A-like enzyme
MRLVPSPPEASVLRPSPVAFLLLAVWFGLLAGLSEVLFYLGGRLLGVCSFLFLGRDFLWLTPLTNLVFFAVPGLLLCLVSWLRRRGLSVELALFLLAALFALQLLLLVGKLYLWATFLLAIGVGVQAARLLTPRWERFYALVRWSVGWQVVTVLALVALAILPPWVEEKHALAQLPPARPGAPNVLFITLDTVRAENLSLYGYHRQTSPELERWAKRGVCFRHALSAAPWTLPSHACLFTGHYPHQLTATWDLPLGTECPTLAEVLRDHGYLTAGFVGNTRYTSAETGLARGFVHYEDYRRSLGNCVNGSVLAWRLWDTDLLRRQLDFQNLYGRKDAETVNREFLSWLSRQEDRPFFAFINYYDAHDPYLPPPPFNAQFGPPLTVEEREMIRKWWPLDKQALAPEYVETALRGYDSALAYLDHQVGKLLEELEQRGVLDNTLVIITADHGEQFGEHDLFLHGNSLYRQLLHVPLLVLFPDRVPAGATVEHHVTLRDLPATVMELVGLEAESPFPGTSLACCWQPDNSKALRKTSPIICVAVPIPPPFARADHGRSPVAGGKMLSLFSGGKYYINNLGTGTEEVYDGEGDPHDEHNLVGSPEGQRWLQESRQALQRLVK